MATLRIGAERSMAAPPERDDAFRQAIDACETPEACAERTELAAAIERCIVALPPAYRCARVHSYVQGYRYATIAAITGWPVGTVKSRLSRARARLRESLHGTVASQPSYYHRAS